MAIFGPKVWIEVFDDSYKTGGNVAGMVVIEARNSVDVQHIDVVLRCRQSVAAIILNGSSSYRSSAVWQRLSLRSTVFPSSEVFNASTSCNSSDSSSRSHSPTEDWGLDLPEVVTERTELWVAPDEPTDTPPVDKYLHTYTLNKGVHKFPFEFTIPPKLPSSIRVSEDISISWIIEAKVFRPGLLSIEKWARLPITVYAAPRVEWNPALLDMRTETYPVQVYREAGSSSGSGSSGASGTPPKRSLITSRSELEHRKETASVTVHIYKPIDGIMQAPERVHVAFGLSCDMPELVRVDSISISLRRRARVTLDSQKTQDTPKMVSLVKLEGMHCTLKDAVDQVNTRLEMTSLKPNLSETYRSSLLAITYRIITEIAFYPRERPSKITRVRMATSVNVHSLGARVLQSMEEDDYDERLPVYAA